MVLFLKADKIIMHRVSCSGLLKQCGQSAYSPHNVPGIDHSSREKSPVSNLAGDLEVGPVVWITTSTWSPCFHVHQQCDSHKLVYVVRLVRVAPSILGVNRSSDYILGS